MINLWLIIKYHFVDISQVVKIEKPWTFDEAIKHDWVEIGNGWWNARVDCKWNMDHGF